MNVDILTALNTVLTNTPWTAGVVVYYVVATPIQQAGVAQRMLVGALAGAVGSILVEFTFNRKAHKWEIKTGVITGNAVVGALTGIVAPAFRGKSIFNF
jgi:hypothetical protein